jgi:GNAT superfamily N-acetyltransferase
VTSLNLRTATLVDCAAIEALIARSIRHLGAGDYSSEQIEAALKGAFGLDTQLIKDGTYFVVEIDGRMVGCGGWSRRRTLFGNDAYAARDAAELDPKSDAAKVRAFFVDPDFARQGIGRTILEHCEAAAVRAGFACCELMATLPGVRLYTKCGYSANGSIQHRLTPALTIEFVPMRKEIKK